MKVRELIEKLQQENSENEVWMLGDENDDMQPVNLVYEVEQDGADAPAFTQLAAE